MSRGARLQWEDQQLQREQAAQQAPLLALDEPVGLKIKGGKKVVRRDTRRRSVSALKAIALQRRQDKTEQRDWQLQPYGSRELIQLPAFGTSAAASSAASAAASAAAAVAAANSQWIAAPSAQCPSCCLSVVRFS